MIRLPPFLSGVLVGAGLCLMLPAALKAGTEAGQARDEEKAAAVQASPTAQPAVLPGRGLIRPEATLTTLQKLQEDTAALRASLKEMDKAARENTKEREDLRRRLQDADEAADAARKKETQGLRRDLEDVDTRLKAQAGQMASLLEGQEAWRHKQDLRLNSLEEFRADFEDKKERLAGMADLMAAMKKDLNDDSQEIAQLKSQVEALNQKAFRPPEDDNLLLQAARWPYTPLVAVAISVVTMITLTVHK